MLTALALLAGGIIIGAALAALLAVLALWWELRND